MRYKPEHKQATREKILSAAGRLLRTDGIAGASVQRVMRKADLTVGGFYGHFSSKDVLVAETLRTLLDASRRKWLAGLDEVQGAAWLDHFARRYLTQHMRDDPSGCALPAVFSELGRSPAELQAVLHEGLEPILAEAEARLPPMPGVTSRQRALAALSMIFGAMVLARATRSQRISDELLAAARAVLGSGEAPAEVGASTARDHQP